MWKSGPLELMRAHQSVPVFRAFHSLLLRIFLRVRRSPSDEEIHLREHVRSGVGVAVTRHQPGRLHALKPGIFLASAYVFIRKIHTAFYR